MTHPHFFGYGSLVHRGTHDYPVHGPARLQGWRRVWRHSRHRQVAFLTVVRVEGSVIDGLVAQVPNDDWAALDERERAYDRVRLSDEEAADASTLGLHVYEASPHHTAAPSTRHPVLMSYLDTVIGGYLNEFGRKGADVFFDTTDGWDAPILNDRANPIYPRTQYLDASGRDLVDGALRSLLAQVQEPEEARLPGEGRAGGAAGLIHYAARKPD